MGDSLWFGWRAWGQFVVWVEDNLEATTMIKIFEDEVEIMADDLNQQGFDKLLESKAGDIAN